MVGDPLVPLRHTLRTASVSPRRRPAKTAKADGELVVTSKSVYFISPAKSLSFKPSRILDIIRRSNGLEIAVNARQGSGHYLTSDAEELEAILTGVVSKHKSLLSESYSDELAANR